MPDKAVEAVARAIHQIFWPGHEWNHYPPDLQATARQASVAAIAAHDTVLRDENERLNETLGLVADGLQRMNEGDIEPGHPGVTRALDQARTALGEPHA